MLNGLWLFYLESLQRNPLLTKCFTSLFGFVIGDLLAQLTAPERFNALRTLRFAVIGFCMHAPVASAWFGFLEEAVYPDAPSSMSAVLIKMALDQLVMSPLFLIAFFAAVKTLEGQPHKLLEVLREKYLKTIAAGYIIWPLAHIINFRYVPGNLRILYINCVQLGWNVILCKMSSVSVVRQHSARRYTEKRLPDQLQMGLLDRRPSGALQMRSAGSLRPHSAEEVRYKAPIEGISPYRSDNAARI